MKISHLSFIALLLLFFSACLENEFPEMEFPAVEGEPLFVITSVDFLEISAQRKRLGINFEIPRIDIIAAGAARQDIIRVVFDTGERGIDGDRTSVVLPQTYDVGENVCFSLRYEKQNGEISPFSEFCYVIE